MKHNLRAGINSLAIVFLLGQSATQLRGQQRLSNRVDAQSKTLLRGSRNPRIEGLISHGAVADSMWISGTTLRFKPTHEQQVELEKLLGEQQDPTSARYRVWSTPEQYGQRFGLNADDYSKVREWIAAQGFQVD